MQIVTVKETIRGVLMMSANKVAGSVAAGLMMLAVGGQLPAQAQAIDTASNQYAAGTAGDLTVEGRSYSRSEASELGNANEFAEESVEIAQARRRMTGSAARGTNFVGVGANFGYVDDTSVALIGKFSVADRVSVRPVVAFGENTMVQVPFTYEFSQMGTNVGGFQVLPYAGAGGAWSNKNNNNSETDESDIRLLFVAGVDVPVSRDFTVNAQANLGVINETEFGATIGVGYNIGNLFR